MKIEIQTLVQFINHLLFIHIPNGHIQEEHKVYCLQFFMNSDKTTNINIKDKNTKRQFIKGLDFIHKNMFCILL